MFCIHLFIILLFNFCTSSVIETDLNFRVEPGARTCFFEKGLTGQVMEAQYQVIDGQHGDLDISFDIINPKGIKLVTDYKKPYNSIILNLEEDGDYVLCFDNSYSIMNSKLVFVYVMIEDKNTSDEATVAVEDNAEEIEILEWMGVLPDGENYYIEVTQIAESLTRTLHHVLKARYSFDVYNAIKSTDSYRAFKSTFVVDVWSAFQISLMISVGMLQVYMIKKLFDRPSYGVSTLY